MMNISVSAINCMYMLLNNLVQVQQGIESACCFLYSIKNASKMISYCPKFPTMKLETQLLSELWTWTCFFELNLPICSLHYPFKHWLPLQSIVSVSLNDETRFTPVIVFQFSLSRIMITSSICLSISS